MKAMLFAAGRGTRLQPLTDHTPKCLVKAGGKTLLEHNIEYLKSGGVDTIVINTHHLADQVKEFTDNRDFGVEVRISHEVDLLETGGGLLNARRFFDNEEAFVVCNSDIYTDFDLMTLIEAHRSAQSLATLAVADRETSRYLRFNENGWLCGWEDRKKGKVLSWSDERYQAKAFNGLQVVTPGIFNYMEGFGERFTTIKAYLMAAQTGQAIASATMGDAFWIDIGTEEKLKKLDDHLSGKTRG